MVTHIPPNMSGIFSKLMAHFSPTPEKPTFRITALVAPATSQQYFSDSSFSHADLIGINETITFDVDCDAIPKSIRCSCLASGRECKAEYLKEHYVIEWTAGSILENEEVEIGGETSLFINHTYGHSHFCLIVLRIWPADTAPPLLAQFFQNLLKARILL
ncbi:uncharacterized protein J4E88_005681 [Alternaria novae-zelandiae]|uniref:uncharacterized protein n=1 Tax=Alternaria novae-zelandiae TaxID=430562 RepID=UPI0020C5AC18|nr:uncharacterized protein J4E88_005681 [Alternaria novae-zelandiae]KAI4681174.1 hypothetical protein J4E88_005681 [Alternaria novae-zelandiae]